MAACVNHPEVTQGVTFCMRCRRPVCPNCYVRLRGLAYCGTCKTEQVRDIQSGTVEGELELASTGRRFSALWIDSMIFSVLGMVGMFALLIPLGVLRPRPGPQPSEETFGFAVLAAVLAFVVAIVVYEALMLKARGQTLGKMAVGIRVVTPDGAPISTGQAWGRAVLRQVFFSYFALINYLPALFTKQRTCLHDMIVKTRVVRTRR
jgi:uncharacterized RDD family membrane protein YckC